MLKKGFIRVKKIKGQRYAYNVVNRWYKNKGPRQKVKGYLGKVLKVDKVHDKDFLEGKDANEYAQTKNKESIIIDLIRHELLCHGFVEENNRLIKDNIHFIINDRKLLKNEQDKMKNIVLELNEGFMCNQTLHNLFYFKAMPDKNPYYLAKAFLEAGLKMPEELFVAVYDRFF